MKTLILLTIGLAMFITGCADEGKIKDATSKPSATSAPSTPAMRTSSEEDLVDAGQYPGRIHIVEPKDTLFRLAEQYYGNSKQWRKIWQANKKRLTNPNDLPVGMKLIIP